MPAAGHTGIQAANATGACRSSLSVEGSHVHVHVRVRVRVRAPDALSMLDTHTMQVVARKL